MRKKKVAGSFIDQYVRVIREFEDYLCVEERLPNVEAATPESLQRFVAKSKDGKEARLFLHALKSYFMPLQTDKWRMLWTNSWEKALGWIDWLTPWTNVWERRSERISWKRGEKSRRVLHLKRRRHGPSA